MTNYPIFHGNHLLPMQFTLRDRKFYERLEHKTLAPYATTSENAHRTRRYQEKEHPYRTAFQRDRDRIVHSRSFRRLKHKQQVFLISEGDHYRTRITHTLEVSQLARTLAKALGLNEELTEAIALGHDLGHTPFGHIGEVVLNEILSGRDNLNGLLKGENIGGFKHNYQSLRVVDLLEKKYEFEGLNLTAPVREGILKHTRLLRDHYSYPEFYYDGLHFEQDMASTLEGQVVAICDEIAQRTHDLEDGVRAGLVELEQVIELDIIQQVEKKFELGKLFFTDRYTYRNKLINNLINFLIDDIIQTTLENINSFYTRKKRYHLFDEELVRFSQQVDRLQAQLNEFIYKEIIFKGKGHDINHTNKNILRTLVKIYLEDPSQLSNYIFKKVSNTEAMQTPRWVPTMGIKSNMSLRIIADHVASMTDRFAILEFEKHQNRQRSNA